MQGEAEPGSELARGHGSGSHGASGLPVKNRGFATLGYPGRGWGMVKLTPEQQDWLVRASPSTFSPVNGASGPRSSRVGAGLCRAAPNLSGGTGCRRPGRRFAPSVQPPPQDLAASQNAILSRLGATARAVQAAVQRWPEPPWIGISCCIPFWDDSRCARCWSSACITTRIICAGGRAVPGCARMAAPNRGMKTGGRFTSKNVRWYAC